MNLIFDWGGTLSDTFERFVEAATLMFDELNETFGKNHQANPVEFRKHFGIPYMKFWNYFYPELKKETQDNLYKKYLLEVSEEREVKEVEGASEVLKYLDSKGHNLFVVSSDRPETLIKDIKDKGFDTYFNEVYSKVHEKKEVLNELVEKYNMDKTETYYIGDIKDDVLAAKSAGIKSVGFSGGFQSREFLEEAKPDYLVNKLVELKNIF
ncbi:MAG: HAD family hydrolase [Candidatus Altiarchaeota archaeon]|nr:HAD family hydrolase [Candidatus Altiarchaeota archaeon]